MRISQTIEIRATPEQVWQVLSDVTRWPEWTPTVIAVRPAAGRTLAVGSRYHIRQPRLPTAVWEVTELEHGTRFAWAIRRPGLLITASHRVERHPAGAAVTLELSFSNVLGRVVGPLARRLCEQYVALEARALQREAERSA